MHRHGLAVAFVLALTGQANAEELIVDVKGQAYCALYAREQARIDIMHTNKITAEIAATDYPTDLAVQIFRQCLSVLPNLLPLTENHRDLDSWAADMRELTVSRIGTEPAGDSDGGRYEGPDSWKAACRAEYRSWDEATGTVVRKGSPDRVRCPCGNEVVCDN